MQYCLVAVSYQLPQDSPVSSDIGRTPLLRLGSNSIGYIRMTGALSEGFSNIVTHDERSSAMLSE